MSSRKQLPAPLVPTGANLRDFPFTPMFRSRLFQSSFHMRMTDTEWRAGVTLWLKSWDQVPAGSLPNDDFELCQLAELGRDQRTWKKIRAGALHGWFVCADGRLYHRVVAEGVLRALEEKQKNRWLRECARIRQHNKRRGEKLPQPSFEEWIERGEPTLVTRDTPEVSRVTSRSRHTENRDKRSKGKGREEGRSEPSSPESNLIALPQARTVEKNPGKSAVRDVTGLTRQLASRMTVPKG